MTHWHLLTERWVMYLQTAGVPATTITLRRYHLGRVAAGVGKTPGSVTFDDLSTWLSARDWAPNTRRSYRASLRAFYTWALAVGLVQASPAHLLPPVRIPRPMPRPVPDLSYSAALRAADDRTRKAMRLAAECGLRRTEVAQVRGEHVEPDLIGWSLRVVGKGGHVRLTPLPDDLARELLADGPGWAFPSSHGGHLTPAHLGKTVSRLLPDAFAIHSLRHRAGTKAYAGTHDLRATQEFLGHAKPETTMIYTLIGREDIRAAMLAASAA